MKTILGSLVLTTLVLAIVACGGPGPGATVAPPGPTSVPPGAGGVRIQLSLDGGSKAGDFSLTHPNPCHYNRPTDGAWALTVTFPGAAASQPSIVDWQFSAESSFVDVWFGNEMHHAEDVTYTADDRGATATLTAQGEAVDPGGGASYPLQITVECDVVARF